MRRGRHGIGLALSGGGYRAALFHLGALRRLFELGVPQDPEFRTISSVSGGSLTAAAAQEIVDGFMACGNDAAAQRLPSRTRRRHLRRVSSALRASASWRARRAVERRQGFRGRAASGSWRPASVGCRRVRPFDRLRTGNLGEAGLGAQTDRALTGNIVMAGSPLKRRTPASRSDHLTANCDPNATDRNFP